MLPWDMHDAFDRSLVDATQMALSPMISMSVQVKARRWTLDNSYTAGNVLTVNLDWWKAVSMSKVDASLKAAPEFTGYQSGF